MTVSELIFVIMFLAQASNYILLYPTLGISDQIFDGYINFMLARGSMSNTLLRHVITI